MADWPRPIHRAVQDKLRETAGGRRPYGCAQPSTRGVTRQAVLESVWKVTIPCQLAGRGTK